MSRRDDAETRFIWGELCRIEGAMAKLRVACCEDSADGAGKTSMISNILDY